MQVSQIAELDTHAVIGGGQAHSFEMSDSAEFFTVLSDTLYRDKKRAVVREVICNGWDAHIMSGKTDVPVEVTLTESELTIKDFGPGIPDDKIVPIYCRYGASTKVKDLNQTGGFGLGSKAPFAYSDHFTVTSCHAGFKTVYAISRGGVATEGRPDIRVMVRVPTTETGITVSIPLREDADKAAFDTIARSVAFQGGMLVKINNDLIYTIDYTEARKTGYCLSTSYQLTESRVYLLYGTVLYPVSTTDKAIIEQTRLIGKILGNNGTIILIAKPNTVGVTPAREALSYSEMTTKTVLELLDRAKRTIEAQLHAAGRRYIAKQVKDTSRYQLPKQFKPFRDTMPVSTAKSSDIAYFAISQNPAEKIEKTKQKDWIYDAAIKLYPNDRTSLRNAKARELTVDQEAFQHTLRLPLRLAGKFGRVQDMMIFKAQDWYEQKGGKKMVPAGGVDGDGKIDNGFVIAPNMRELQTLMTSRADEINPDVTKFIAGMVVRKPSEDLLVRMRAQAKAYKLTLKEFEWEKVRTKVARKAPEREKFYNLDDYNNGSFNSCATLTEAKFFIRGSVREGMASMPFSQSPYWLKMQYPGLAFITTTKQEETLRAGGAKNVYEDLFDRFEKISKRRDVQYAYFADRGMLINTYPHNFDDAVTAYYLMKRHFDVAKALFPDRAKKAADCDETLRLISFIESSSVENQFENCTERKTALKEAFLRSARKALEPLILGAAQANKKFAYLGVLRNSNWASGNLTDKQRGVLIETIRFLQKRNSKSSLIETALKEAA